jgi:hypothetical protein
MKALKTILILCAAICCFASCKKEVDMTLVQKTVLENADIRQIKVDDAWQVTLVADNKTYVELQYSAYLENYIQTKMDSNQLQIGFASSVRLAINSVFRATVHVKQLEKVEVEDAANVQCSGDFSGQRIEINLSEASQCNGLVFSGESCEIQMDDASLLTGFQFVGSTAIAILEGASQYNGQIQVSDQLEVDLNDASRFVNRGGETEQAIIKLQNASILNMVETQVGTMHVDLSGGSEATIRVVELLEGLITNASIIYYKGQPRININCSDDSQLIPF